MPESYSTKPTKGLRDWVPFTQIILTPTVSPNWCSVNLPMNYFIIVCSWVKIIYGPLFMSISAIFAQS